MSKKDKLRHVKLIVNPGAGNPAESENQLKLVIGSLEEKGLKVAVAFAKPKRKATSIAKRAIKDGYKVVIAMGGDGTIEAVMRGMIGSKVRLGLIATGTENNIAKSLGIPSDLEEACALIASNDTLKLDVGKVSIKNRKKFYFFELATIGIAAAAYPATNKVVHGMLSKVGEAVQTFIDQDAKPTILLTLDDESKIEVETMMVMVSNTPIFGVNFQVAPRPSLQDGLLDISLYPDFSKVELLSYYAAVMNGGYSGNKKVQHYQARKVKIKASPKLDVMADAIPLGKGNVTIKVQPAALRVITTENYLGAGIPQKNGSAIQPAPIPLMVGKNHQAESVISSN